jgi:hypothetical protein
MQVKRLVQNIMLHLLLVIAVVWWQSCDELVQEDAKAVEVNRAVVGCVLENLWTEVLGTSAYGLSFTILCKILLR